MNATDQIARQIAVHVSQPVHECADMCREATPLRRNLALK